jgi:hypothetical protein
VATIAVCIVRHAGFSEVSVGLQNAAGCCAVDPAEEDAAYDEMLAERRTLIAKLEAGESENDDFAGILDDEWTDDEEIETALNNVDVFNMLITAMNNMKSNEPERFQVRSPHHSNDCSLHSGLQLCVQD